MSEKQLRDISNILFVRETDPKNPYGPNYEDLPHSTKIYYKFVRMKKYVTLSESDLYQMNYGNLTFYGGLVLSSLITVSVFHLARVGLLKNYFPAIESVILSQKPLIYAFFACISPTLLYDPLSDYYVKTICIPHLEKYINEAVSNGFEDYEISPDTSVDKRWSDFLKFQRP